VNNDIHGPVRRRNISTLRCGTGGGNTPVLSMVKPGTAAYNTARGSSFNRKFRGVGITN